METENKKSVDTKSVDTKSVDTSAPSTPQPLRRTSSTMHVIQSHQSHQSHQSSQSFQSPPRIIRNMSDVDLGVLQKAVVNTCPRGHVQEKKAPRICFFYNHDKQKTRQARTLPRRRVMAYVWDSDTGTVFYGGSVYNPNSSSKGSGRQLSRATALLTQALLLDTSGTQMLSDLKEAFRMGDKALNQHPQDWDKIGERSTAYERLRTLPVVFRTAAKDHKAVRDQIRRMSFVHGVKGGSKIECSLEV